MRPALTVLAVLTLPGLATAAPPAEVVLKREVRLTAETVTLGDVARVAGAPEQVALVRKLPLGPLPAAGRVRTWSRAMLRLRLRAAGLEASLVGAKSVRVRGRYLQISARRQVALAQSELKRRGLTAGATLGSIRPLHVRLAGTIGLTATVVRRSRRELRVRITARSGSAHVTQVIRLRRRAAKPASAKPVTAAAPKARPRRETARQARPAPEARVAPASAEDEGPLIRPGQQVQVVARRGAIELTLRGRARTSGARGAIIKVRLQGAARRTVESRVIGPGRVALLEGTF